ncbi:MAG: ankyrin repeat domain-containing protein [Armatimonadota bacterium]
MITRLLLLFGYLLCLAVACHAAAPRAIIVNNYVLISERAVVTWLGGTYKITEVEKDKHKLSIILPGKFLINTSYDPKGPVPVQGCEIGGYRLDDDLYMTIGNAIDLWHVGAQWDATARKVTVTDPVAGILALPVEKVICDPPHPLFQAIQAADLAKVRKFLDTVKFPAKALPLSWAVNVGTVEIAQLLLERRANVDMDDRGSRGSSLYQAVDENNLAMVKLLLTHGAKPDGSTPLNLHVPLVRAARLGNQAIVTVLLQAGANVNLNQPYGGTPLMNAVFGHHRPIVELLLLAGADVKQTVEGKSTVLHTAVICKDVELAGLLLKAGANINARNTDGLTPLALARKCKYTTIAEYLQQHGGIE